MTLEPDQIIDNRYKIVEHLGQGGMGAVWKAIDTKLDDEVVLKLPLNHLDNEILKRFGHEAKTMRRHSLDCPFILNIEDVGSLGDVPYYVMRFLPGGSARDQTLKRDNQGNIQWDSNSFKWLTQIASALDYLHGRECFHRDVKPENILFSGDGVPYLVDFGIVKNATETTTMMTQQGHAIGTLAYMAPEILDGEKFTAQSDQYALAVTLYESITGDRPFSGTTYFSLFKSIQKGHPKLSELYSNVPNAASIVIDRALSENSTDRFESCGEFADRFIAGVNSTVPVNSPAEPSGTDVPVEIVEPQPLEKAATTQQEKQHNGLPSKPTGNLFADSAPKRIQPTTPTRHRSIVGPLLIGAGSILLLGLLLGGLYLSGVFRSLNDSDAATPRSASLSASFDESAIDSALEPEITNSLGMRFRLILAGEFTMGTPENESGREDDETQHQVKISEAFYLGKFEVTQGQWKALMGTTPWAGKEYVKEGDDFAATYVSWEDAISFCRKLSKRDGVDYRLPSEAQWEYACRGGSQSKYSFGNSSAELGSFAWFNENTWDIDEDFAHVAGLKLANKYGLYDMHGNVWEWCSDWYGSRYYQNSPLQNPTGPREGSDRVIRGGAWSETSQFCRSANRGGFSPRDQNYSLGFRVCY